MALTVAPLLPLGPAEGAQGAARAGLVMYELQPPEGYSSTVAELLSEAGHAVGSARDARGEKYVPVRWEPNGTATPLSGLGGDWMWAKAINDDGIIAGTGQRGRCAARNATLLPDEKPGRVLKNSLAQTINNAGQILGSAEYWDVPTRAVIWR
ncbi:hypothetical protein [Streptomyces sp. H27-H5]|uniref:hypothetical protein n=1 Tax=Streptomyces sp. H27-H5 TaxID=2996460 RepID=UPI0022701042|nr:hypothetical protein [Streptomyces sp. H27-H5]MCY0962233.1 hypothetical protein [Streptomyces sp. H27-H5]